MDVGSDAGCIVRRAAKRILLRPAVADQFSETKGIFIEESLESCATVSLQRFVLVLTNSTRSAKQHQSSLPPVKRFTPHRSEQDGRNLQG